MSVCGTRVFLFWLSSQCHCKHTVRFRAWHWVCKLVSWNTSGSQHCNVWDSFHKTRSRLCYVISKGQVMSGYNLEKIQTYKRLVGWVLLYVHKNRRLIRNGSPGRPPRLSHSSWTLLYLRWRWWCRASCPRMSVDILGTNCDQCRSMVQYCFTSTETVRLIRTESPGRPPRHSHSSWTLNT